MAQKQANIPIWMQTNAWREILARIFEGFDAEINISPDWLINPATNRRLKLDMLYPTLGVAVRFEGLQGKKQRRRLSLEEEVQHEHRHNARVELCRDHGIELIIISTTVEDVKTIFQDIDVRLSRVGSNNSDSEFTEQIRQARTTTSRISRRVGTFADLKAYADLWEDRQYQLLEYSPDTTTVPSTVDFTAGMEVEHSAFGPGVITAVTPNDDDTLVTVDFLTAGEKTLAASLVGDKLIPR